MKTKISLCCDNCKESVIEFFVDNIRDIGKEYHIEKDHNQNILTCHNCSPRG